jgi:hypothetical protein
MLMMMSSSFLVNELSSMKTKNLAAKEGPFLVDAEKSAVGRRERAISNQSRAILRKPFLLSNR